MMILFLLNFFLEFFVYNWLVGVKIYNWGVLLVFFFCNDSMFVWGIFYGILLGM